MRRASRLLAVVALSGCAEGAAPYDPAEAPPPPAPPPAVVPITGAFLWGVVVDRSGACLAKATVEVMSGPGAGERAEQVTPCGVWDSDGGFLFTGLTSGVAMTIRASAPGYVTKEVTATPDRGPQTVTVIALERVAP
jgi:hypothetical protein